MITRNETQAHAELERRATNARSTGCWQHEGDRERGDHSAAQGVVFAVAMGAVIYGAALLMFPHWFR